MNREKEEEEEEDERFSRPICRQEECTLGTKIICVLIVLFLNCILANKLYYYLMMHDLQDLYTFKQWLKMLVLSTAVLIGICAAPLFYLKRIILQYFADLSEPLVVNMPPIPFVNMFHL